MLKRKIAGICTAAMLMISFCAKADAETFYIFSTDDPEYEVQFAIPEGWSDVEPSEPFDLKLTNETRDKQVFFVFGIVDSESITQQDLEEAAEDLEAAYFNGKQTSHHEFSLSPASYFHMCNVEEENGTAQAALVICPIKNYLFAIIVENRSGDNSLITDCNFILQQVGLIPHS